MAVFKRMSKRKGEKAETAFFHYRFMAGGHDFSGVCEGCATKEAAEKYEADLRAKAELLAIVRGMDEAAAAAALALLRP
jgi:hypothetical protein